MSVLEQTRAGSPPNPDSPPATPGGTDANPICVLMGVLLVSLSPRKIPLPTKKLRLVMSRLLIFLDSVQLEICDS